MAYDIPTAASLIARYPAFAAVPVETIDIYITDAATQAVDRSWRETDYGPAITAYAAHQMMLLGIGNHGEHAEYLRNGVTDIWTGSFRVKFADPPAVKAAGGKLDATPYGRIYKLLLRINRGGPRVVAPPAGDDYGWCPTGRTNDGTPVP